MNKPPQDWYIDCKGLQAFVRELIDRCGNSRDAEAFSGVSRHTMYRILNETCQGVQPDTARRLLAALARKRLEDRRTGATTERFRKAKLAQAALEEKLERMAGY